MRRWELGFDCIREGTKARVLGIRHDRDKMGRLHVTKTKNSLAALQEAYVQTGQILAQLQTLQAALPVAVAMQMAKGAAATAAASAAEEVISIDWP